MIRGDAASSSVDGGGEGSGSPSEMIVAKPDGRWKPNGPNGRWNANCPKGRWNPKAPNGRKRLPNRFANAKWLNWPKRFGETNGAGGRTRGTPTMRDTGNTAGWPDMIQPPATA